MRAFSQSRFAALSGGRSDLVIMPAEVVFARALAPRSPKLVELPPGAARILFSGTGDFCAQFGSEAVQASAVFGDSDEAAELNPSVREVPAGATHLSLVAPAPCFVTLSFFS